MIEVETKLDGQKVTTLSPFVKSIKGMGKTILKPSMIERLAQIVRAEQRYRISSEKQSGGGGLRDLKPSTWKRKKTKHKLIETGRLYKSIRSTKDRVFIEGQRAKIGAYLHFGTKRIKPFNWWGVDSDLENKAIEYLSKEITFDGK